MAVAMVVVEVEEGTAVALRYGSNQSLAPLFGPQFVADELTSSWGLPRFRRRLSFVSFFLFVQLASWLSKFFFFFLSER